jgi:hypothetical protein
LKYFDVVVPDRTQKRNGTNEENKETKRKYEIKRDQPFFEIWKKDRPWPRYKSSTKLMFWNWCVESSNKNCLCQGTRIRRTKWMTLRQEDLYFLFQRINIILIFIVMFLYHFQFLIIHVNGRISFGHWSSHRYLPERLVSHWLMNYYNFFPNKEF